MVFLCVFLCVECFVPSRVIVFQFRTFWCRWCVLAHVGAISWPMVKITLCIDVLSLLLRVGMCKSVFDSCFDILPVWCVCVVCLSQTKKQQHQAREARAKRLTWYLPPSLARAKTCVLRNEERMGTHGNEARTFLFCRSAAADNFTLSRARVRTDHYANSLVFRAV